MRPHARSVLSRDLTVRGPHETSAPIPSGPVEAIAYDEVARAYRDGLLTRLRGFRVGPDFLDAWVDDEDPVKAVFDMFDAARAHGLSALRVLLEPSSAARFDRDRFGALVAQLGTLSTPDRFTLDVRFSAARAESAPREVERVVSHEADHVESSRHETATELPLTWTLHDDYVAAVSARAAKPSHEGAVAAREDLVTVRSNAGPVSVTALVDRDHRVREARHEGAVTAAQRGLLEALCETVTGMSLREASDHAVIRVEHALRDPSKPRPVAGIVLPENASAAFRPLLALARGLLADYRAQGHELSTTNFEYPTGGAAWLALDGDAQTAAVQRCLDDAMRARGFEAGAARCLKVAQGERVTLTFSDTVPPAQRPALMMALERALAAGVDAALHVYLEERKDLNKLRRL